ncbi:MAG: hypothetical protein H5T74_01360 [Actinobacteria bacterium]|nr:hypothetical protein [Actinomycetota bacterium]
MSGEEKASRRARGRRLRYRDTVRMVREHLRPVDPGAEFARRLEELCVSMGARELFDPEREARGHLSRRGVIIGGAICSALPFLGVAAYAIGKLVHRRRVIPVGA